MYYPKTSPYFLLYLCNDSSTIQEALKNCLEQIQTESGEDVRVSYYPSFH